MGTLEYRKVKFQTGGYGTVNLRKQYLKCVKHKSTEQLNNQKQKITYILFVCFDLR